MIEDFTSTAITTLLTQGTGWVVAVLLGIWSYLMDRRLTALKQECDRQLVDGQLAVREQYDKRIEEFKVLIETMNSQTATVRTVQSSQQTTTEAINQLAIAFANMVRETEGNRALWVDRVGAVSKTLEDIRTRVEHIQRDKR